MTLASVAVLAVNDHLLKGALPGWLTGKLSDVAGLIFAPLLLTTLLDGLLFAATRLGVRIDPSLDQRKLLGAIAVVGLGFSAIELWPPATDAYLAALSAIGLPSAATADPTDLLALPALALAFAIGRAEIARVPLGRLAVIRRDRARAGERLADVRALSRTPAVVDRLAAALAAGDDRAATTALDRLRG